MRIKQKEVKRSFKKKIFFIVVFILILLGVTVIFLDKDIDYTKFKFSNPYSYLSETNPFENINPFSYDSTSRGDE